MPCENDRLESKKKLRRSEDFLRTQDSPVGPFRANVKRRIHSFFAFREGVSCRYLVSAGLTIPPEEKLPAVFNWGDYSYCLRLVNSFCSFYMLFDKYLFLFTLCLEIFYSMDAFEKRFWQNISSELEGDSFSHIQKEKENDLEILEKIEDWTRIIQEKKR
ncbi:hypothetical protein HC823_02325 [Candidatus Gracilibacteria bacterium]|nr:hypothetical protein [Candidatus Gracilibacteria bacterium]